MCLCAFQVDIVPDFGFLLKRRDGWNKYQYNSSEMNNHIDSLRKVTEASEFAYTTQSMQQVFERDVPMISLFYRTGTLLTRKMFTTARTLREFELFRGIESFGK